MATTVPTSRTSRGVAQPSAFNLDMCMSCGAFTEFRGGDHLCADCRDASMRREERLRIEDSSALEGKTNE